MTAIDDEFAEQDAKLRARCEAVRRLLAEAREDTRRTQRELDDAAKAQRQTARVEPPAAPENEPSQKSGNGPDAASAAVLGPVIAGAFLVAVLGLGLVLRRRRRKLSKDVAEAIDVDKDVEEPPRIVFHEPPPPPPPLPPQTPGAGSPAGLVELDGLAPPPWEQANPKWYTGR